MKFYEVKVGTKATYQPEEFEPHVYANCIVTDVIGPYRGRVMVSFAEGTEDEIVALRDLIKGWDNPRES